MNERYKTMLAVRNAAILKLPPVALTIISPPSHGKTETKKIFLSQADDCFELTSSSDTALGDELLDHANAKVIILDDPLNWERNDYVNAVRYFKNLHSGEIVTPRRTKYKRDNIAVPANIHTITLMHSKQWNETQRYYMITGFEERSLICWSTHSQSTMRRVSEFYMIRDHTTMPLPIFTVKDFELLQHPRKLTTDEREWINKNTLPIQSTSSIARAISEKSFKSIMDYVASNSKRRMFIEEIGFDEGE